MAALVDPSVGWVEGKSVAPEGGVVTTGLVSVTMTDPRLDEGVVEEETEEVVEELLEEVVVVDLALVMLKSPEMKPFPDSGRSKLRPRKKTLDTARSKSYG